MKGSDRYLKQRGERWHYVRRVPTKFAELDDRDMIRVALRTGSREIARMRRDALAEADEEHWALLASSVPGASTPERLCSVNRRRYRAACQRAMGRGFAYAPAAELASTALLEDLLERIAHVNIQPENVASTVEQAASEALLGGVEPATTSVSEAFDLYCRDIAADELIGKSPTQRYCQR